MEELLGGRGLAGAAIAAPGPPVVYATGPSASPLWIDGEPRPAGDGRTFKVENPATGANDFIVARGGARDVDLAVGAARRAARNGWPAMHPRDRGRVLRDAAALLAQRADAIAEIETRSVGRPLREMRQQVRRVPEWLEFFASVAEAHEDRVVPAVGPIMNYVRRVPLGVIGQITPWNHPLLITIKKVAPALASGNSVVVKPSELAPVAPLELARALVESGIPEGTVNVVPGFSDAGEALVAPPGVDRIVLTGGTETGRRVAEAAGRRLVPVQAELGGKTPVVVFDDVPTDVAVAGATFAGFVASGQSCIAGTRLIVHRRSYDGVVESARADGASVLTGGVRLTGEPYRAGHYMGPTVITDLTKGMRIMREEVFGPVITVEAFEDESEAAELANDSPYGLGAAVWSYDLRGAHRYS